MSIKACQQIIHPDTEIKATMIQQNTPIKLIKIKKTDNTKWWQAYGATKTHFDDT